MIIQPQCGFYQYNGVCYGTREELLDSLPAGNIGKGTLFNYNDDIFANINWSQEPDISLDDLYLMRAKHLREKYDYLILSFSGGSDCNEILEVFLRNNIFIDEIQTVNFNGLVSKLPEHKVLDNDCMASFLEYDKAVVPKFKRVALLSPNTKITVIDASDYLYDQIMNKKFEFMGLYDFSKTNGVKMTKGLRSYTWYLHKLNNENPIYKNKKVAFIRGYDKPSLIIKNNFLFTRFNDFALHGVKMIRTKVIDNIYTFEDFYWSSDFPLIPVKQGHAIKKFIELTPAFYLELYNFNNKMVELYTKNQRDHIKDRIDRKYSKLLYRYHEEIPFVAPKPWTNPEMVLMDSIEQNYFEQIVQEKTNLVLNRYKNLDNKFLLSRNIFTRHYNLGRIHVKIR
jgi:hypothetical protein